MMRFKALLIAAPLAAGLWLRRLLMPNGMVGITAVAGMAEAGMAEAGTADTTMVPASRVRSLGWVLPLSLGE